MNELKGSGQTPSSEKLTRITLTPGQVDDLRGKTFGSIRTIFTTENPLNPLTESFLKLKSTVSVLKEGPSPEEQIISWFGEQIVRPSITPPTFTDKLFHAAGEAVKYLAPKLVKTATGLTVFVPIGNMPDNLLSYAADFTLQNSQPAPAAAIDRPSNYIHYIQALSLDYAPVSENLGGDSGEANSLEIVQQQGYTGPGFQSIAMNLPLSMVGKALGPETPLANGDVIQLTENGAMFWRKADNWTAYTDGSRTWVMGPYGLQERGNNERFDWEAVTPVDTARQRIYQSLQTLIKVKVGVKGGTITNPYSIDPNEIQVYLDTGNVEGYKTFKFLFNTKGEPAFILVTKDSRELKPELGNAEVLFEAVKRLNEVDPEIINVLTNKFGLKAFTTGDPAFFKLYPNYDAGFTDFGAILLNETTITSRRSRISIMATLIVESRHMYYLSSYHEEGVISVSNKPDRLADIGGVDKARFLRNWVNQQNKLSPEERQELLSTADFIETWYTENPM